MDSQSIQEQLKNGAVGILATDTLYGLVGSALAPESVSRIYDIKGRTTTKALIILISSRSDLQKFGITVSQKQEAFLDMYWPGKISIVLPCSASSVEHFEYLHRGLETLAFRMPDDSGLRELLSMTGPLVAPSANPEGDPPAVTIEQAKDYFGDTVDFYVDGGMLESEPSTLVSLVDDEIKVIRQGVVKIV